MKLNCPKTKQEYCYWVDAEVTPRTCRETCRGEWEQLREKIRKHKETAYRKGSERVKEIQKITHVQEQGDPFPSITQQALNFGGFLLRTGARKIVGKEIMVTGEMRKARWDVCTGGCCHFRPRDRCALCGCHMEQKVKFASEWCKDGRWGVPGRVSVVIPSYGESEEYLQKTVESVESSSEGDVEIIIQKGDGEKALGYRWAVNRGVRNSTGQFIMVIDGHCSLSQGWDRKLREAWEPGALLFGRIQALRPDWTERAGDYRGAYLDEEFRDKWLETQETLTSEVCECMALTGCGWFVDKFDYWKWHGLSEQVGKFGAVGGELSLKTWLSGGRVLLHQGVTCGHLFREAGEVSPHGVGEEEAEGDLLRFRQLVYYGRLPAQVREVDWLYEKFKRPYPVPPRFSAPVSTYPEHWKKPDGLLERESEPREKNVAETVVTTVTKKRVYGGGPGTLNVTEDPVVSSIAVVSGNENHKLQEIWVTEEISNAG